MDTLASLNSRHPGATPPPKQPGYQQRDTRRQARKRTGRAPEARKQHRHYSEQDEQAAEKAKDRPRRLGRRPMPTRARRARFHVGEASHSGGTACFITDSVRLMAGGTRFPLGLASPATSLGGVPSAPDIDHSCFATAFTLRAGTPQDHSARRAYPTRSSRPAPSWLCGSSGRGRDARRGRASWTADRSAPPDRGQPGSAWRRPTPHRSGRRCRCRRPPPRRA